LKGEIEKKNQFNKKLKKQTIKKTRIKLEKITFDKLRLKDRIENK
jgi:hypothetical protein